MLDNIYNTLIERGIETNNAEGISNIMLLFTVIVFSILADLITKKVLLKMITHYVTTNKYNWDNIVLEKKVFHRLSHIIPALIVHSFAPAFPIYSKWIQRGALTYIIFISIFVIDGFLNATNDIYKTFPVSKIKPIKGYIQVIKIFVYTIGAIVVIATIIGQSPVILLSGIGALTAVLLIVFKDSLLGLVAGIQLASNDMVHIGDWIEMTKYGADGDVIDISLNTVKVQNFDKTITTIPTYALISDSFKNWRGMKNAGGRRIKRSVFIDTASICFCSDEVLERYMKIHYIAKYLVDQKREIEKYNSKNQIDLSEVVNGRRLTNIGVFRVYIQNYLRNHPKVHPDMVQMVRQLPPEEHGLPLEIYCFTNDVNWVNYETVQADIFDHILAVAPQFGLRIFQEPTGYDLRNGLGSRY